MLPLYDVCTVYHGTNLFAAKIIRDIGMRLDAQRDLTDFGKGFYVTLNPQQAKSWAQIRAMHPQISSEILDQLNISQSQYFNHPDIKIPAYLAYELNLKELRQLKGKEFPLPHEPEWPYHQRSWERFVQECRAGKKHHYDYVYGPVGGRHLTDPDKIKVSHTKDQLSLNSPKAIRCLSKLKIVACQPEGTHAKKSIIKQLLHHVRSLESVIDNNKFLLEIHDELMAIGNLTSQQADKVLRKSLATLQLNPIMMHEPAAYWSFSILYGRDKLWHKEYEIYMRKKNRVRK